MATQEQSRAILRSLGYTGEFGQGGAQAFLNSDPTLRQRYNNRIAARNEGYLGEFGGGQYDAWKAGRAAGFDQGGVAPVGVLEPLNQWQRQGLESLATYASAPTAQGYMQGGRDLFQTAKTAATALPIQQSLQRGQQFYDQAGNQLTQGTRELTDEDFASGISRYMNPYLQNVVDTTLSDIDRDEAVRRSNLMSTQAGRRSFGDSSSAIQLSELARNFMDTKARTGGQLRYQGFNDSADRTMNQFNQERGRNLQASGQYGSIAGSSMNDAFRGFNTLGDLQRLAYVGNQSNVGNFNALRDNEERTAKNRVGAGSMVQDQNQKMLDVVRGETDRLYGFDEVNLANLAQYLSQFPQSSNSQEAKPERPNTLGKIGAVFTQAANSFDVKNYLTGGRPWKMD